MAWALDNFFIRITDTDGDAINGAKLYIFAAGTSTASTIYSNNVLSTTHANPVVADSGGKIAGVWLAAGSYKLRLTDADGNTLYEVDNYVVPDLSAIGDVTFEIISKTADYTVQTTD